MAEGGGGRRRRTTSDRGALSLRRRASSDRGAVTLEFAGMFPIVLVVMAILWECVLYGYTYSLAGNAADEAARAATAAYAVRGDYTGACQSAGAEHLPDSWQGADIECSPAGPLMRATVHADVPLFFPGVDLGWSVDGTAGAALEGPEGSDG
ncbi:Flp pilus assembly protein TadG [Streptomyces sp. B3I8]|nr:Flp pilus assembly protein TadG [Streptomyces sp. B3I8]